MNDILIKDIKSSFITKFATEPVLVFSPGRINLIGEHTDYNNGFVFPAAIDKGIVTAIQKSEKSVCSVVAGDMNEEFYFSLDTIQPIKNGDWKNFILGVVSEIQKKGKRLGNFNLVFGGDIPSGSGLSSSAAIENSVVFGLNEVFDLGLTKKEMIFISQKAEHNYVGVKCGIMDQYASMFGIKDSALLLDCKSLEASPYLINFGEYQLLLINTNVKHSLAESAYNDRRSVCEKVARILNIPTLREASESDLQRITSKISTEDYQKALYIIQENNRVLLAAKAIKENAILTLGSLLYQSHDGLQNQYQVSCPELDFLTNEAKNEPAVIGARMMGGGFGGCTINLIKKDAIKEFIEKTSSSYKEKFNLDCTPLHISLSRGTHVL
ncbi:MAG: galactokinase [Cellulophaga sp.]